MCVWLVYVVGLCVCGVGVCVWLVCGVCGWFVYVCGVCVVGRGLCSAVTVAACSWPRSPEALTETRN